MNEAVRGQDLAAGELERPAMHVGYNPSCLFDEQDPGSGVPGVESEFPEAVYTARCDATKIQGSGAGAAHSVGAQCDLVVVVDVRVFVALVAGKTGGH